MACSGSCMYFWNEKYWSGPYGGCMGTNCQCMGPPQDLPTQPTWRVVPCLNATTGLAESQTVSIRLQVPDNAELSVTIMTAKQETAKVARKKG